MTDPLMMDCDLVVVELDNRVAGVPQRLFTIPVGSIVLDCNIIAKRTTVALLVPAGTTVTVSDASTVGDT